MSHYADKVFHAIKRYLYPIHHSLSCKKVVWNKVVCNLNKMSGSKRLAKHFNFIVCHQQVPFDQFVYGCMILPVVNKEALMQARSFQSFPSLVNWFLYKKLLYCWFHFFSPFPIFWTILKVVRRMGSLSSTIILSSMRSSINQLRNEHQKVLIIPKLALKQNCVSPFFDSETF